MKKIIFLSLIIFLLKGLPAGPDINNQDIISLIDYRDSLLENYKILFTVKCVDENNNEIIKYVDIFARSGDKLISEKMRKSIKQDIHHEIGFYNGQDTINWVSSQNFCSFLPKFLGSIDDGVNFYFTDWSFWWCSIADVIRNSKTLTIKKIYSEGNDTYAEISFEHYKSNGILSYEAIYNLTKNIIVELKNYDKQNLYRILKIEKMNEIKEGLWFPLEEIKESYYDSLEGNIKHKDKSYIKIIKVEVNDKIKNEVSFDIPPNSMVYNRLTAERTINGEQYKKDLTIDEIDSISKFKPFFNISYKQAVEMLNEIK